MIARLLSPEAVLVRELVQTQPDTVFIASLQRPCIGKGFSNDRILKGLVRTAHASRRRIERRRF